MSEIDNAWSETSGGIAGEDSPPPVDFNLALDRDRDGLPNGYHHYQNGYVEDGDQDVDEDGLALPGRGLRREDTIKPGDSTTRMRVREREMDRPAEFPRGIRWAPIRVSPTRRLQTLMVLYHTLSISIFLSAFFLTAAIPLTWPLLLPYLIHTTLFSTAATDGTLSRRSPTLRSLRLWSYFASYFPAQLHRSVPLNPKRKYIFGYHPHGIISHGAFAAFATEACNFATLFPGITNTLLTLDSNFRLPFYRDYALAMGLASVSRESCENLLSKGGPDGHGAGRAITIVVGGARESLDARPGVMRLILKRRRGFIKLAVRTGADLVPVIAFGENELYEQVRAERHPVVRKVQMFVKNVAGFTVPLFHARGVFNYDVGLLPYRRGVDVLVGRPIEVVKGRGDAEYVDELQGRYVAELRRMWEEGRERFGDRVGGVELEIVG